MKTVLQIDIDYDQVLALVKQLPKKDKILLSKELEKEEIESKLTSLLSSFKTDELSEDIINEEVERARREIYERH